MLKCFILLSYIYCIFNGDVQDYTDTKVFWSPHINLSWNMFTVRSDPKDISGQNFSAAVYVNFEYSTRKVDSLIYVTSRAYMLPTESWRLQSDSSLYGLIHEQGHFNIAEVSVRKFRELCADIEPLTYFEAIKLLYTYSNRCQQFQDSLHEAYDLETNHSLSRDNQSLWNNRIDSMLAHSMDFCDSLVIITTFR